MNLFTGSIFAIILFSTVMWFGSQAWASLSFVPTGWGANCSQNCHSCSFCSHKQVLDSSIWALIRGSVQSQYLFSELEAMKTMNSSRFFKNVTNFPVIWVKRRPKAGSVDLVVPELIQLILAPKSHHDRKSKGEKERARRKKGGGEKKSNGCTLSFCNGYYDGFFLA